MAPNKSLDHQLNLESPSDLAAQFRKEMEKRDPATETVQLLPEQLARGDNAAISRLAEMSHEEFIPVIEAMGHTLATDWPLGDLVMDYFPGPGLPSDDLVLVAFDETVVIPLPPPPGFGRG